MTNEQSVAEQLAQLKRELDQSIEAINSAWWTFTRTERGHPVPRELYAKRNAIERKISDILKTLVPLYHRDHLSCYTVGKFRPGEVIVASRVIFTDLRQPRPGDIAVYPCPGCNEQVPLNACKYERETLDTPV